jgi:hypothetical protein
MHNDLSTAFRALNEMCGEQAGIARVAVTRALVDLAPMLADAEFLARDDADRYGRDFTEARGDGFHETDFDVNADNDGASDAA